MLDVADDTEPLTPAHCQAQRGRAVVHEHKQVLREQLEIGALEFEHHVRNRGVGHAGYVEAEVQPICGSVGCRVSDEGLVRLCTKSNVNVRLVDKQPELYSRVILQISTRVSVSI